MFPTGQQGTRGGDGAQGAQGLQGTAGKCIAALHEYEGGEDEERAGPQCRPGRMWGDEGVGRSEDT